MIKTLVHIGFVGLCFVFVSGPLTSAQATAIGVEHYAEFADSPEASFAELGNSASDDGIAVANEYDSRADRRKVAIYDDNGAWPLGVKHTKLLLKSARISYRVLSAKQILAGQLTLNEFDTLFMPGGKSWLYLDSLGESGQQAVREFVDRGGSYFGTCAGAFFAVSNRKDRKRDNVPYGIGLLEGTAYDGTSLGTAPFKRGMMTVNYHLKNYKSKYRVLLLGGPGFIYTEEEALRKNVQILATYPKLNQPAMITLQYGRGRVAIMGPHGEIDEKKVTLGLRWKDPDSEWPLLRQTIGWLRGGAHPQLR